MMTKLLDWGEVPSEFKYRAVDCDGRMFYYTNKPYFKNGCWYSDEFNNLLSALKNCENPELTLEERPKPPIKVDEEVIVLIDGKWYAGKISSHGDNYFIDPYDSNLSSIQITPITVWRYISELEIEL